MPGAFIKLQHDILHADIFVPSYSFTFVIFPDRGCVPDKIAAGNFINFAVSTLWYNLASPLKAVVKSVLMTFAKAVVIVFAYLVMSRLN